MMMNKTRTFGVEKFDVVVMNPPYNSGSTNKGVGHTLWDKFVIKVLENILVEDGYLVAVHPDGWRLIGDGYKSVKELLKSKQIIYLEVHNEKDGLKTFKATTTYDIYCLKNINNKGNFITKIKCMDGTTQRVNISKMEFIPNGMYVEFNKLLAKPGEAKTELLHSRSAYGTDKKHTSKIKNEEFKYPIVYTTLKDGTVNLIYSNTNKNGFFNIQKVIWSNGGATTPIVDSDGKFGLTEFTYAIADSIENLPLIQKAMLNPKFIELMKYADGKVHRYNRRVLSLFRKDFWVDFLDYNNDDE